jgi:hypothetical protein
VTKATNAPVTYYIKVELENYKTSNPETTIFEPFTVEFKNCVIENLLFNSIVDQTYNIYTDGGEVDVPAFTQDVQTGSHVMVPTLATMKSPTQ